MSKTKTFSLLPFEPIPNVQKGIDYDSVQTMISFLTDQTFFNRFIQCFENEEAFLKGILSICLSKGKGKTIKVFYDNNWMANTACHDGKPLILNWEIYPENTRFFNFRVNSTALELSKINGHLFCKVYQVYKSHNIIRNMFVLYDKTDIIKWENIDFDINKIIS